MYDGKLVYQNSIPKGTEFLSSPVTTTSDITLKGVSSDWSNLSKGISIKYSYTSSRTTFSGSISVTLYDLISGMKGMNSSNGTAVGYIAKLTTPSNVIHFQNQQQQNNGRITSITAL